MSNVEDAKRRVSRFRDELRSYYKDDSGAINFIAGALNEEQRVYVSDYLIDLVQTIDNTLGDMRKTLVEYSRARDNEEFQMKNRLRAESSVGTPQEHSESEVRFRFHRETFENSYFFKFGGVIDLLAACLIVSSGVSKDVRTVSHADLTAGGRIDQMAKGARNSLGLSEDPEVRASQLSILHSMRPLTSGEENRNWFPWLSHYRNRIVHRAQGVEFTIVRNGAVKGAYDILRLPGKYPEEGMISGFARPDGIRATSVHEDMRDVMNVSFSRLCDVVIATIDACSPFCGRRSAGEINITQQAGQWPTEASYDYEFNGFSPDESIKRSLKKADTIVAHGSLLERMEAASALIKRKAYPDSGHEH
ncbi:hypothetical protein [Kocuria atrinae]|uniref:Uncharacterized protein n=1 Tax=Kocuria atrinae TaxID=592377 RepID=A0ABN2Y1Y3_9MICC